MIEGGVEAFVLSIEKYEHIEHVYYFAGKSTPSLLEAELYKGYFSDQETLVMMLESCAKLANIKTFVYGSSGGTIYGDSINIPCIESQETKPISAYGLSKLIQENYILFLARKLGYFEKIARISNPYGRVLTHGSKHLQGFIDTSIDKITKNETIEIWGDGEIVRDFIHISDLVEGIKALSRESTPPGIYNIGSGKGYSLNEIISIYESKGIEREVKYIKSRYIDVPVNILDIKKIQEVTDWVPKISLETGISEILSAALTRKN